MKNILELSSSGRTSDSVSRQLSKELLATFADRYPLSRSVSRNLADGVPNVDAATLDRARASIANLEQLHDAA